ncbi:MAG: ABC transporter substrate-binding protein [Clostridiales bacterium]|nr:ABC transporter substrate-binding protein [Roseburia sp.]MDD7637440.1 ABC transporter substrate-binding protein [Clostridiales bacterium]MDY4113251.1 ABC transporter substrate-binding protein [Roseburia sp.]
MKRKMMAVVLMMTMTAATVCGCGSDKGSDGPTAELAATSGSAAETATERQNADATAGAVYKVGIVQYVDDASLNQIEQAIEAELDAKGAELGVTFDYADYTFNGQADQTILTQIAADLIADDVDIIIPIATPTAVVMQSATEENQIPVVFSAVSDPAGAGLVADNNAPGANVTGTSDAIDTKAIFDLILAANPDTAKVGLLYDKSQASSLGAIKDAKAYCDENGISYVEKTGTTAAEVQAAADALVAEGVDAVFTPQDNTIMTAELSIFEKFIDAGIPHYTGADSFALNGAFCGYGVNYEDLGTVTADMVIEILVNGANPAGTPVQTLERGIVTVNTETAEAIGLNYSVFKDMCSELVETVTAENFE